MDLIIAGIIGWCGTGWPRRFPPPSGGSGGWEPGDWGPPGCWVCGRLIGALGGIIAVTVLGSQLSMAGMVDTAILAFFGGSFLAEATGFIKNTVAKR